MILGGSLSLFLSFKIFKMSCVMRKSAYCICENKGLLKKIKKIDQLDG